MFHQKHRGNTFFNKTVGKHSFSTTNAQTKIGIYEAQIYNVIGGLTGIEYIFVFVIVIVHNSSNVPCLFKDEAFWQ